MARVISAPGLSTIGTRINRLIARPDIQALVMRLPFVGRIARRDGAEIFYAVQGFVASQVLMALVGIGLFDRLASGPATAEKLAAETGTNPARMSVFLQAGAALGFLRRLRGARFGLSRKGAALRGVPGLTDMILHHRSLYRDLEEPVNLLRGTSKTQLSAFWPYVLSVPTVGEGDAERYSHLMAQSQRLISEDILRQVRLGRVRHLLDVGGGSGAFLAAVAKAYPGVKLTLFDLPETRGATTAYLAGACLLDRVDRIDGNFMSDNLPPGADVISLVRVLYDHGDVTVRALLAKVFETLPAGGRVIISEPMSGGARPDPITDVYFAVYTLAMGTGRTRSAAEIGELLREAGFENVVSSRPLRSYITTTLTAVKRG